MYEALLPSQRQQCLSCLSCKVWLYGRIERKKARDKVPVLSVLLNRGEHKRHTADQMLREKQQMDVSPEPH